MHVVMLMSRALDFEHSIPSTSQPLDPAEVSPKDIFYAMAIQMLK